ncbi:MAG TPA: hypothetical protein VIY49_33610 [Bryobacteraceae bacterium]
MFHRCKHEREDIRHLTAFELPELQAALEILGKRVVVAAEDAA